MFHFYFICLLAALPIILMAEYFIRDLKKHEGNEDSIILWRILQIASPIILALSNILK
jgi:hypothetical protein